MTMPSTASPSIDTPRGRASWDASAGSGVEYRQLSRLAVFPSELAELTLDSREDGTLEVFGSPKESAEPEKPREELMPKAELERLMRVLDERLAALAIAEILGDAKRVEALAAELGIVLLDGRVLVAARVEAGARDRIAALGLAIEAEDTGRGLVVMRVAPGAMRRLAATEGVRRVEPVRP